MLKLVWQSMPFLPRLLISICYTFLYARFLKSRRILYHTHRLAFLSRGFLFRRDRQTFISLVVLTFHLFGFFVMRKLSVRLIRVNCDVGKWRGKKKRWFSCPETRRIGGYVVLSSDLSLVVSAAVFPNSLEYRKGKEMRFFFLMKSEHFGTLVCFAHHYDCF